MSIQDGLALLAEMRQERLAQYRAYRDYYEGKQKLNFASEKFRSAFGSTFAAFADNLIPVIVESVKDRLSLDGFVVGRHKTQSGIVLPQGFAGTGATRVDEDGALVRINPTENEIKRVEALMAEVWRRARLKKRSKECHRDSLIEGDTYLIVWPDSEGWPVFHPQKADTMGVLYDDEEPGYIIRAAKAWQQRDGRGRVTIYYPDRIEKYITKESIKNGWPTKSAAYMPYKGDPFWPVKNPWEKVPVFHFANRSSIGTFGDSEFCEAIPIQDALNKSVADMLVAMEFFALPQRWATGLQVQVDPKTGKEVYPFTPNGLWYTSQKDVVFGEFSSGNLQQFVTVSETFRKEMARVSRTPLHYFTLQGDFPSGESLKTAEAPLIAKVEDRQVTFGMVWEDAMRFALRLMGEEGYTPEAVWLDVAPRSETELVQQAGMKRVLGVSRHQILRELGYSDQLIEQMEKEDAADTFVSKVEQQMIAEHGIQDQKNKDRGGAQPKQGVKIPASTNGGTKKED